MKLPAVPRFARIGSARIGSARIGSARLAAETAWLVALVALVRLPAVPGAALVLLVGALWLLSRPPRREVWLVLAGLAATAGLALGGVFWERRAEPSEERWLAEAERGYAAHCDELEDAARAAVASLYELESGNRTELNVFEQLQALILEAPFDDKALIFYDPDGEAVAWAGPGLLHEPGPEELPTKGFTFRRGYSAVTLSYVLALDSTRRSYRLLVGQSLVTHELPFAAVEAPGSWTWSLTDDEVPRGRRDGAVYLRPRPEAPALALAPRPPPAGVEEEGPESWTASWWAEVLPRLSLTALGLVYLTLAYLRGLLPERRRAVSAVFLAVAGIVVLGEAARLAPVYLLATATATAFGAWGLLRRPPAGLREGGAEVPGALAVLLLPVLAWWFQDRFGLSDLADHLGGGDQVLALRLTGCLLALGLLSLAARRGPPVGDGAAWTAMVLALAAAAFHDRPLVALPLLAAGGGAAARWLRGLDLERRPMALGGLLLIASVAAATSWEIAYREHFRALLKEGYLPRVAPPSLDEANDIHTEIHEHFEGYELRRVLPPGSARGTAGIDPQDLAFSLWRDSPLPQRDGASALKVELAGASRSSFSFGLPLDRDLEVSREEDRWPIPAAVAWHDAAIFGSAELRLDGEVWGVASYTFMPRPGFRLEVSEIAELEEALLRGTHRKAIDGLPRSVLFGIYDPAGRAITSPWEGSPPLAPAVLEAGEGTIRLPAGRFFYWAASHGELTEVLFLPRLLVPDGLERVGVHALGSLLVIAGLVLLVALPRSIAVVRELVERTLYSYSKRLMLVYTALLLLPLVALNLVLLRGFEQRLRRDQQNHGQDALASARLFLLDYLQGLEPGYSIDTELSPKLLDWVSHVVRHQINLYWGSRLYESSQPALFAAGLLPKRIPGDVFSRLALLGHEVGSRTQHSGKETYVELYAPLAFDSPQGLFLSAPLLAQEKEVARELEMIERRAVLVTTALFLLLLAVGSRLARRFTTPIMELIDGTREIARGADFLAVTPREHELGKLADAIDDMARSIAEGRRRLVAEKQVVEHMVENITSAVVSLDHQRRVLLHNRQAAELLGVEVGTGLVGAVADDVRLAPVAEFLAAGDAARQETVQLRIPPPSPQGATSGDDGEIREWTLTWVPVPGPDDPAALLVVDDATEVLRGERLEAWAEMARIIAHEIKNPLTPIRLSTEHLRQVYASDRERLDEVFDRCTDNILGQVEELRDIASDFSIYSRIPRAELAPGDLVDTLRGLVDAYRDVSPESVELAFASELDELRTRFDAKLLGRAVRNLLENALRASALPRAEAADPGTDPDGVASGVAVKVERRDGEALISVVDSGPGIEPENLPRIFDPYFSTHETGTGLGLAIAKRIVLEHGGHLEARNRSGGGLAVVITIPLVD